MLRASGSARSTCSAPVRPAPSVAARSPAARTRPPSSRKRSVSRPPPARRAASATTASTAGGEKCGIRPSRRTSWATKRASSASAGRRAHGGVLGQQLEAEAAQPRAQRRVQVAELLGVGGHHEHRVARHRLGQHHRAAGAAVAAGDRELALLERGEQPLLALEAQRRDLVDEEDAAVCAVHRARARPDRRARTRSRRTGRDRGAHLRAGRRPGRRWRPRTGPAPARRDRSAGARHLRCAPPAGCAAARRAAGRPRARRRSA